jgi:hypothetical protein
MATLSYSPAAAVAGDTITLSLGSATHYEVGEYTITSVPSASALSTWRLQNKKGEPISTFVPDVPGTYGFKAHVFLALSGTVGDIAFSRRDLVSVATGTVYVGNRGILTVAALGQRVDIRIVELGGTVLGASLVNPVGDIATLATLDATVLAAVAALVGVDAGLMAEDLVDEVTSLLGKFYEHIRDDDVSHFVVDSVSSIQSLDISSVAGAIGGLNILYDHLMMHLGGTDTTWHHAVDLVNVPIVPKATSRATATVLLADLRRRVYARHIATVDSVHAAADTTTNIIVADLPLTAAIVAILDFFAARTPSTPTGENPAHAHAAKFGFSDS